MLEQDRRECTGSQFCSMVSLQVIIDELEREREMLANTMAEKVRDHQQLLQVKMDLGMEVAYYRYVFFCTASPF